VDNKNLQLAYIKMNPRDTALRGLYQFLFSFSSLKIRKKYPEFLLDISLRRNRETVSA